MGRAFIWAALICVCGVLGLAEARWTVRPITSTTATSTTAAPRRTTTTTRRTPSWTTTLKPIANIDNWTTAPDGDRTYHPADIQHPRLIEQYDQRSLDGHYEYRYALSNGDTRYERAYWVPVGKKKVLAKKGYYSYPLPNRKFFTVYYTADQNGYHQDSSTYSKTQPLLPRSIAVPEHGPPEMAVGSATTERRTTQKRSPTKVPETKRGNDKPNQTVDLGVVSAAAAAAGDTQTTAMTQSKDQLEEVEAVPVVGDKVEDNVVDIQAAVTQSTVGEDGTVVATASEN